MILSVLVPALIFVVCFGTGTMASARWLPDLDIGPIGDLAFFTVCGLLGSAFSLLGMHVYLITEEIRHLHHEIGLDKAEVLAGGIRTVLFEVGSLTGIATIVFLLAPRLTKSPPAS